MKIIKAIAGATVALAVAGTGWAWASSQSGHQRFLVHAEGSTFQPQYKVVASGPISGIGYEHDIEDRSGDGHQDFTTEFVFPKGTVTLEIQGPTSHDFNPVTCAGTLQGTLRWRITGGTGAYDGATGSGKGTFVDRFVTVRGPDGCVQDQAATNLFTGHLSGTASA